MTTESLNIFIHIALSNPYRSISLLMKLNNIQHITNENITNYTTTGRTQVIKVNPQVDTLIRPFLSQQLQL